MRTAEAEKNWKEATVHCKSTRPYPPLFLSFDHHDDDTSDDERMTVTPLHCEQGGATVHCESTHLNDMEDNDAPANDDNYNNAGNDNYDDNDDNDDDDDAEEDSEGELEGRPLLLPLRPCCPVNRRHRVITPSQLQLHLVHTVPRKHSTTVTLHHGITTMYDRTLVYHHGTTTGTSGHFTQSSRNSCRFPLGIYLSEENWLLDRLEKMFSSLLHSFN